MIAALWRERNLMLLAVVLVVQVAALVLTRLPGRVEVTQPLLAGLTVEGAMHIKISDYAGQQVVLAREESGWVLPDVDDYPADDSRVTALLRHLASARRDRPVVRTESGARELRVVPDIFERRLQVQAGEIEHLLYIGTVDGTRAAHVRVDGEDEVWRVAELASWQVSADLSSWADTFYLRVEPDQVAAFELENAAGSFPFQRTEGGWTGLDLHAGETLDQERVTAFVDRLSSLRMSMPLGTEPVPHYRLNPPAAVVHLTVRSDPDGDDETEPAAERVVQLIVGAVAVEGDHYVVKNSDSEYYVEVSSFTLSDLVDADRSTFVIADDTTGSPLGASSP